MGGGCSGMDIHAQKQVDPVKDHVYKKSQRPFVAESGVNFAGYELSQKITAEAPGGKAVEKMQQFTYIRRKHCLFLQTAASGFDWCFKCSG